MIARLLSFVCWLALATLVILLDQWSKWAMLDFLVETEKVVITPFFNLSLAFNSGAAFSFLAGADGWQRWFFIILAVLVSLWIVYMLYQQCGKKRLSCALSLIMGGAIGNVIDRINHGAVVDFIQLHAAGYYFPTFNLADSAITCGAVLLIVDQLLLARAARCAGQPPEPCDVGHERTNDQ